MPADRRLTPAYASPEQIRGAGNISTASHIYSLGILLYELLCGCRPYALDDTPPSEWARSICVTQPAPPSVAVARHDPVNKRRAKELQGDLDTIVLMAIRKEPERRYVSVEQFSADIANYLEGFAVTARKDSPGYRASKLIRSHRAAVIASALFIVLMIGFAAGMAILARQARRERDTDRAERTRAEQVSRLLLDAFHLANPQQSNGDKVTAREILDRSVQRIRKQPLDSTLRADLLDTLSPVYLNLNMLSGVGPLESRHHEAIRPRLIVTNLEKPDLGGPETGMVHEPEDGTIAGESTTLKNRSISSSWGMTGRAFFFRLAAVEGWGGSSCAAFGKAPGGIGGALRAACLCLIAAAARLK